MDVDILLSFIIVFTVDFKFAKKYSFCVLKNGTD